MRLGGLDRWPEHVRLMQENWIGRSEGARVFFGLAGQDERLEVFTTRQDTLFGASFSRSRRTSVGVAPCRAGSRPGRLYRRVQPHGHQRSGHRDGREAGYRDRP